MRILWTEPAATIFTNLPRSLQHGILGRIELISEFPNMYPVREHQPYAGFRYFFTGNWCVSYVAAEDTIVILAVFPARRGG